jgi:hypothetical protein
MARTLVIVGSREWSALTDKQRQRVETDPNVVYVQAQRVGSFQPGDMPVDVIKDTTHTHLLLWNTYPRFGEYADNDQYRDARPGLQVVELGSRATYEQLDMALAAIN